MSRGDRRWLRWAFVASTVLHGGVIAGFWATASRAAPLPPLRVFAVDIVSPPPREQGEWTPEPTGAPEVEPTPAEEIPPEPKPEPPVDDIPPPAEPEPAPEEPSPAPPKEPSPPKPATKKPVPPTPPKETPRKAPEEAKPPATQPDTPAPSTGAKPDAASPGGEDLNVRTEGMEFVDPAYLENIQRQINRYFRRPSGARTEEAEVRFWISRNGSVSEIEVIRSTGSFAFRAAAMEAVEQAGLQKAFGSLPEAYPADRLLVSFYFRPAR